MSILVCERTVRRLALLTRRRGPSARRVWTGGAFHGVRIDGALRWIGEASVDHLLVTEAREPLP